MNLAPVNMLKSPKRLRGQLERQHELLITNNGKPMAIMFELQEDEDPELMLRACRKARSALSLTRVREAAKASGASDMSLDRINEVISDVRRKR